MPDEPEEATTTWHEREVLGALRRLASAQSQVAHLEEQLAAAGPPVDPDEAAAADELQAEIEKLRPKAQSRFGGGSARDRLVELEASLRLVLDRMGFADYEELAEVRARPKRGPAVDPTVYEFAKRELQAAEQAWQELQDLDLGPAANGDGSPATIDLDAQPPAAS